MFPPELSIFKSILMVHYSSFFCLYVSLTRVKCTINTFDGRVLIFLGEVLAGGGPANNGNPPVGVALLCFKGRLGMPSIGLLIEPWVSEINYDKHKIQIKIGQCLSQVQWVTCIDANIAS